MKDGQGGSALPLRGFKSQTFEGGMRVTMIAKWKGKIPANVTTDKVATTMDLLPTIAYLTNGYLPEQVIDGKNIWPLLTNKKGAQSPYSKKGFYYYYKNTLEAIRLQDWKLRIKDGETALYNLKSDISESKNLADENPKKVQELQKMMQEFDATLKKNVHQFN